MARYAAACHMSCLKSSKVWCDWRFFKCFDYWL